MDNHNKQVDKPNDVMKEDVSKSNQKKKKKRDKAEKSAPHDYTKTTDSVQEMMESPRKKKKRSHVKKEETTSCEDVDEAQGEETAVVPEKKRKKRKHDKTEKVPSGDDRGEVEFEDTEVIHEEQQPQIISRKMDKPVGVQDLQNLVQYSLMGNAANINKVSFCKVMKPALIPKVAVIVLNGVTDEHYQKHPECFAHLSQNHDLMGQILHQVPSQQQESILNQLLHVVISNRQLKKRAVPGVPAQTGTGATPKATPLPARATPSATPRRTHYLLDDEQKDIRRYPKPDDPEYTHTKHSETVGDNSPLISVDCEMCVTKKGSELTRVSLVDEKHNMLYDSLVKPHNPIIDYVTRFSGITKELLDPVTVRLEDVQRDILALLPPDAILVGQSLENDLRALKLYHPHVIDTSNLFTGSYRVALRKLAWKYLGVKIQEQETGHKSEEDATIALKLLQLKLEKGSTIENYTSNGTRRPATESLFCCAQPKGKFCILIDSPVVAQQFWYDPVGAIPCQNDSEALEKTVQFIPYSAFAFICVQFYNFFKLTQGISQEADVVKETLKQLDQSIKKIYETLPINSLFLVVMAADPNHSNTKGENVKDSMPQGRFFTGLKLKY